MPCDSNFVFMRPRDNLEPGAWYPALHDWTCGSICPPSPAFKLGRAPRLQFNILARCNCCWLNNWCAPCNCLIEVRDAGLWVSPGNPEYEHHQL